MRIARRWTLAGATILVVVAASTADAAQNPIEDAKNLYVTASFENALAVLERLNGDVSQEPDVLEYKALCLLALGRPTEAQSVADALVTARPTFVPSSGEDVSPRFVELLTETRKRLLPDIAKRMFADAREQFRAKDQVAARKQFEQVLVLASDPAWSDQVGAEDLRTLASGFLDLMETPASIVSAPSVNVPPQPAALISPAVSTLPDRTTGKIGLTPPVQLTQSMPKWQPRDALTAQRRYVGALRVRIGADGHVVSAVVEVATDPNYDKQLLEATRSWTYKPATRDGEPVEVEKLVTFVLRTN